jgi:RNA polymerase sigma-70 factor (ECF subfamily)
MNPTVEQLCERAQAGDRAAASELVTQFYERIYAYFRRQCSNDQDASDLTQKTFFKVWVSLANYQGRSSFSTWLHGIAHHVYVDWRRQHARTEDQSDEWWLAQCTHDPLPDDEVANRELATRLYSLVGQLDEGVRDVVHLHYFQGLTQAETAEALQIALGTVKYRLRSALDTLRAQLNQNRIPSTP